MTCVCVDGGAVHQIREFDVKGRRGRRGGPKNRTKIAKALKIPTSEKIPPSVNESPTATNGYEIFMDGFTRLEEDLQENSEKANSRVKRKAGHSKGRNSNVRLQQPIPEREHAGLPYPSEGISFPTPKVLTNFKSAQNKGSQRNNRSLSQQEAIDLASLSLNSPINLHALGDPDGLISQRGNSYTIPYSEATETFHDDMCIGSVSGLPSCGMQYNSNSSPVSNGTHPYSMPVIAMDPKIGVSISPLSAEICPVIGHSSSYMFDTQHQSPLTSVSPSIGQTTMYLFKDASSNSPFPSIDPESCGVPMPNGMPFYAYE